MASRASPRSNASSASSSSSHSRRGRRNPNSGRARGSGFRSDSWGLEAPIISNSNSGGRGGDSRRYSQGDGQQYQAKGQWRQNAYQGQNSEYNSGQGASWRQVNKAPDNLHTDHRAIYLPPESPKARTSVFQRIGGNLNQDTASTQDQYRQPEQVEVQPNYNRSNTFSARQGEGQGRGRGRGGRGNFNQGVVSTQEQYHQPERVEFQPNYTTQNPYNSSVGSHSQVQGRGRGRGRGNLNQGTVSCQDQYQQPEQVGFQPNYHTQNPYNSSSGNHSQGRGRGRGNLNQGTVSIQNQYQQPEQVRFQPNYHTQNPYNSSTGNHSQGLGRGRGNSNQSTVSVQDQYHHSDQVEFQPYYNTQNPYNSSSGSNSQGRGRGRGNLNQATVGTQDQYYQPEQVKFQNRYNSSSDTHNRGQGRGQGRGRGMSYQNSRDASILGVPGNRDVTRIYNSNSISSTVENAHRGLGASTPRNRAEFPPLVAKTDAGSGVSTRREGAEFPPLVAKTDARMESSQNKISTVESFDSVWKIEPIKSWYDECADDSDDSPTANNGVHVVDEPLIRESSNSCVGPSRPAGDSWRQNNEHSGNPEPSRIESWKHQAASRNSLSSNRDSWRNQTSAAKSLSSEKDGWRQQASVANTEPSNRDGWEHQPSSLNTEPSNRDGWRQQPLISASTQQPNRDGWKQQAAGAEMQPSNRDSWRHHQSGAINSQASSRDSWRRGDSNVNSNGVSRSTSFTEHPGAGILGAGAKTTKERETQSHVGGGSIEKESVKSPTVTKDETTVTVQADSEVNDDEILPFIVGSCEDMCPAKEREQRERLRDLAVFERVNGNPSKTSKELAVKKFCRTFFGVKLLPSDVRPLQTLWRTLQYLLNLLDDNEFTFDVVHNFLFDRTRAIRQELGMQRIGNSQAITMYEEIVRFHILSEHELNQRGSGKHLSDSHLNLQQLSKSLLSLFELYRTNKQQRHPNEAEFRAYYVLLNLGSNSEHQADLLSVWFRQFPRATLNAPELQFARAVLNCYRSGNYWKFFKFVEEATFLQSCLLELHFNEMRLKGLASMNQGGYKLHPIPLTDIAKQFLIKEGDLEELCNLCGLVTGMDINRVRCLLVKQSPFSVPDEIPFYRSPCIVNKQPASHYKAVTS